MMRVPSELVQALSAIMNIEESLGRLRDELERLGEKLENEGNWEDSDRISLMEAILGGASEYCQQAENNLLDCQSSLDEPGEYEIYPPPDTLGELAAIESTLGALGFGLWGAS
jgi:hypothetical protein